MLEQIYLDIKGHISRTRHAVVSCCLNPRILPSLISGRRPKVRTTSRTLRAERNATRRASGFASALFQSVLVIFSSPILLVCMRHHDYVAAHATALVPLLLLPSIGCLSYCAGGDLGPAKCTSRYLTLPVIETKF